MNKDLEIKVGDVIQWCNTYYRVEGVLGYGEISVSVGGLVFPIFIKEVEGHWVPSEEL